MNLSKKLSASPENQSFLTVDIAGLALDSAQVGIWIMDASSREFLPSNRSKALFGFSSEEKMSFEDALLKIAAKHRRTFLAAIEHAITNRGNLYIECPVSHPAEKKPRWISITGGFSTVDGSNNFFSGIAVDITEQKQNDLRRSKFIGMVSHELKTPLTALKGYVQLLNNWAKKQKDNFTIGALSKVEKQVKKMLQMINSLLNLSSAEAGKIHLNKQVFALEELISEVIEETLFITSSHDIVMIPCETIPVNADREKIEQVLVNLLSNAAKYSYKTAPIEISCAVQEDQIMVKVSDQGVGIAPKDLDKLFLPHYRVESKETEKIAGFGIGLYLCAEIIERHGGKIWAESELEKGSIFKFTLPPN
jgi:signal transduction histidine kinase